MYIVKGFAALETRRHEREYPTYPTSSPAATRDREYVNRFINCFWLPTPLDVIAAGRIAYTAHHEEAAYHEEAAHRTPAR